MEATTQQQQQLELSGDLYDSYINAIKSPVTQYNYGFAIKKYLQFLGKERLEDLLLIPPSQIKLVEAQIISYLVKLKKENTSFGTVNGYLAAIKLFYDINDYNLNKRKLARYLPEKKKASDDRGYTREEIAIMLQGADERVRALILLLACTGMRIGAIADKEKPLLQIKHLHKIQPQSQQPDLQAQHHQQHQQQQHQQYNYNLHMYKITVYEGYKEEYFCFTTPEAAAAIDSYLKYRERYGEKLTPDSFLFREQFNTIKYIIMLVCSTNYSAFESSLITSFALGLSSELFLCQ